jgi:pimeloyl-ACP methyl ester carboxylesterase
MRSVTSDDGTRIAYERRGEGRPLILLHGGSTPAYWKPAVPRYADEYAVLVPHRRGHGASGDATRDGGEDGSGTDDDGRGDEDLDEGEDGYGLGREVADVRAVVEAVAGDPVLFGHSFGGLLAVEAARVASVAAVVAYEPAVLVGEYRERAGLAARMRARLDEGNRRAATRVYVREVVLGEEVEDLDARLDEWPAWPALVDHVEALVRTNRVVERYRLPDSLDVDAPALLLTGSEAPSHLRESVRAVHDALAGSRLVEFEGLGHGGPTEAPERVAAEVRAFVEGAGAREGHRSRSP